MDKVVDNILKRKNNSHTEGKIALVLYGGIMSGVVGTGATTALEELGLTDCFDYVFTYSAGFPNASYFLANQSLLSSSVYIHDLSGSKFINFLRPWKTADINYLIHILKDVKALNVNKIFQKKTKILLRIKNTSSQSLELLEVTNTFEDNYFDLINAAVKMPFLSPGSVHIGDGAYKDSPKLEKGFIDEINKYPDITDVLIIYNRPDQKISINLPGKNYLEIIPGFTTGGLETKSLILEKGFSDMRSLVKSYFNE